MIEISDWELCFGKCYHCAQDDDYKKAHPANPNVHNTPYNFFSMNLGSSNDYWWEKSIENMGLEELEMYAVALEELKKNVLTSADELDLLKKSHNMGMMNVDLNQMITTSSTGASNFEVDLNANQVSSANPNVPYGFGTE
ncbi:OLC1v1036313C1 [Oldenlandia corymbosa var. corymbosa]|uniref:OLC1v1036313C1 n=1 Tax=Oldenlandia corymbosa var. corymbosa TaxID=529605 RepID=A0AAV1CW97_OLDCO|nr:OLC1v1036313C1 [Oldenlandia corymbosa var. corymbosa]